jgi:hypothetical protein
MSTSIEQLPNTNQETKDKKQFEKNPSQLNSNIVNNLLSSAPPPNRQLPPRDIPMQQQEHTLDNQSRSNYIDNTTGAVNHDYIREYREIEDIHNKTNNNKNENVYEEYSRYAILTVLYVLLQLPQTKAMLQKSIPTLFDDGEAKIIYHVLLGVVLSGLYYLVEKNLSI